MKAFFTGLVFCLFAYVISYFVFDPAVERAFYNRDHELGLWAIIAVTCWCLGVLSILASLVVRDDGSYRSWVSINDRS